MHTLESFYSDASELIEKVDTFISTYGLADSVIADHICFKCDSKGSFDKMRELLEPESVFIYQSYISNRRIAVIKLKQPFETSVGSISVLELSDQKPDNSQATRFDHIELYPRDHEYDSLVANLQNQGAALEKTERPHHSTYDLQIGDGYQLKLTRDRLIEKIKRDEMV